MATKWLLTDAGFCLTNDDPASKHPVPSQYYPSTTPGPTLATTPPSAALPPPPVCGTGCTVTSGMDATQVLPWHHRLVPTLAPPPGYYPGTTA